MITLDELKEARRKRKMTLYYEEKEYLQYIFLNAISRHYKNFTFKGGTCLRICYGLERASEDLDFSTNLGVSKIKEIVYNCLKEFDLLNIHHKVYSEKEFEGNFRIEIRFEGPLFSGDLRSTNTVKIDFNKRKAKSSVARVVQKLFSDVPLFTIAVLSEEEIFSEKVRALVNRGEPRDLYDVWALMSKGVKADKRLILEKLREEHSKINNLKFPTRQEYEIGLKNLVEFLPRYEQVKAEVYKIIKGLQ